MREQHLKSRMIADAIVGARDVYPDPVAFLHVFIDYLMIAYDEPVWISVDALNVSRVESLSDGCRKVISKSELVRNKNLKPIDHSKVNGVEIYVHPLSGAESRDRVLKSLWHALEEVGELERTVAMLRAGLEQWPHQQTPVLTQDSEELETDSSTQWIEPFASLLSNEIDAFATEWAATSYSSEVGNHGPFPTILTLFRYYNSAFKQRQSTDRQLVPDREYATRLILSDRQSELLKVVWHEMPGGEREQICRILGTDNEHTVAGQPFGLGSRFAGDSVFETGLSTRSIGTPLSRKDPRNHWDSEADLARNAFLQRVFSSIGKSADTLYVPVHVGGTPWLVLMFPSATRSWSLQYRTYRGLVPRIGAQLREFAETAFLKCLEEAFRMSIEEMPRFSELRRRVNHLWRQICRIYPFQLPQLVQLDAENSTSQMGLQKNQHFSGTQAVVEWDRNPFFPRQVEFGESARWMRDVLHDYFRAIHRSTIQGKRQLQELSFRHAGHHMRNRLGYIPEYFRHYEETWHENLRESLRTGSKPFRRLEKREQDYHKAWISSSAIDRSFLTMQLWGFSSLDEFWWAWSGQEKKKERFFAYNSEEYDLLEELRRLASSFMEFKALPVLVANTDGGRKYFDVFLDLIVEGIHGLAIHPTLLDPQNGKACRIHEGVLSTLLWEILYNAIRYGRPKTPLDLENYRASVQVLCRPRRFSGDPKPWLELRNFSLDENVQAMGMTNIHDDTATGLGLAAGVFRTLGLGEIKTEHMPASKGVAPVYSVAFRLEGMKIEEI